jgi:hypothetical protein
MPGTSPSLGSVSQVDCQGVKETARALDTEAAFVGADAPGRPARFQKRLILKSVPVAYLKTRWPNSPSTQNFDPLCRQSDSNLRSLLVLDVAVEQIAVANRTPATKAKMAERILRAASDGVTDRSIDCCRGSGRYAASGLKETAN